MRGSGLSPAKLRNADFSPSSCSGAAPGAKAAEEFGEARAALIRLERASQGSEANPKFTSWGHDLETQRAPQPAAPGWRSEVSPSLDHGGPAVALRDIRGRWDPGDPVPVLPPQPGSHEAARAQLGQSSPGGSVVSLCPGVFGAGGVKGVEGTAAPDPR